MTASAAGRADSECVPLQGRGDRRILYELHGIEHPIHPTRPGREFTRYAFFTEREGAMAARNGWETLELPKLSPSQLEPNQLSVVEVFQYMVGNTDWSVLEGPTGTACCHNIQLIGRADTPVIPVPYDFDATGVVDAPSAAPDPRTRDRERADPALPLGGSTCQGHQACRCCSRAAAGH